MYFVSARRPLGVDWDFIVDTKCSAEHEGDSSWPNASEEGSERMEAVVPLKNLSLRSVSFAQSTYWLAIDDVAFSWCREFRFCSKLRGT